MRGVITLSAALTLALAGCGSPSTLGEHRLGKEAEAIQSTAAEGAMLAAEVARGRTTEPFARVHSEELAQQAEKVAKVLRQARAPGLEADRRRAAATAAEVTEALKRLRSAPTDRRLARRLELELERHAATAGKLAG